MSRYTSFDVELAGALDVAQSLSSIPGKILRAQKRAIGTMQRRLATEAKRDIGAEYNLKASRIAAGLKVRSESDGIRLIGSARGINYIEFGAKWNPRSAGARYSAHRGGDRSPTAGTFIRTGLNGNVLVFSRNYLREKAYTTHGRYAGTKIKRQYLEAQFGLSIGQMLKHGRRPERLAEFAMRVLESEQRRLLGPKL